MTISSKDFKQIMFLFDAGDFESRKKAIFILYDNYRPHYLRIIKREFMKKKYDDETAEDILQDAFLSLLSGRTKPSSKFAIGKWLRACVFNVTRNNLQKAYRRSEFSYHSDTEHDDDVISKISSQSNKVGAVPINVNSHNDSLLIEKCVEEVLKDLQKNDPEGAELFSKVKTEGIAYSKLTHITGMNENNLRRIVSEFNSLLKDLIQPCLHRAGINK